MGSATKLKACFSCTNGKRKCDKAQPVCGRCNDRDIECRYPPTRRKRLQTPAAAAGTGTGTRSGLTNLPLPNAINHDLLSSTQPEPDYSSIDLHQWTKGLSNWNIPVTSACATCPVSLLAGRQHHDVSAAPEHVSIATELQDESPTHTIASKTPPDETNDTVFFLGPDAWTIRHIDWISPAFSNSVCMNYIRGIQAFFTEWVTDSHSPFIHGQLYADLGYPPAIQDAFTCITLHNAKTPANEIVVDQMLASKVLLLLESYPSSSTQNNQDANAHLALDTREHLSRTQALYVHLVLALFSPSIGVRANAEQHIQTLLSWTRQLWEAALRDPDICHYGHGGDNDSAATSVDLVDSLFDGDPLPRLWRSWVLSESIRRIWLLATSTMGVYLTLRQKWAECHGGIYLTARKDFWDARSASSWAVACRNTDPWFVCSLECERLFTNAKAADVDSMLINLFTIMWGVERVESWIARTTGPGQEVAIWREAHHPMRKGNFSVL
ncbi:hypothetical protein NW762_008197 [Fusarium torreyae]|uniref:Zn(2)-C6 fungal-type domain-containing protein n=1 Tax=Fusarium torreyae TaxID=1237075 RepID=A0A9W8RVV8_9HYPO|nr:hypothetical protein NW762_008197 [Fusarium torreyae]